jgi:hypothetical protein
MSGISCAKCAKPLPAEAFAAGNAIKCPSCNLPLQAEVFPSLLHPQNQEGNSLETAATGEASCFYHPQKRAAVTCESCGRFLCSLCDLQIHGSHLCPNCLQQGKKKGRIRDLERERVLYSDIALSLSIIPILFWPATLLTAPATIYLAIRYWNAPGSIVSGRKIRFILAVIIALAEIAGWCLLFWFLFFGR